MASDEVEILPNSALTAARQARSEKLAKFEADRIARSLLVPTDDGEVRQKLRARGLPTCLFGEDSHGRRLRLREAMAREKMAGTDHPLGVDAVAKLAEQGKAQEARKEKRTEEFYTEGTSELKRVRASLAKQSVRRAGERLAGERLLVSGGDIGLAMRKRARTAEARVVQAVRGFEVAASQVGSERPLSAICLGKAPTGRMFVVSGSWGGGVRVWEGDGACGQLQRIETHDARISAVCVPREWPDVLLTASADGTGGLHTMVKDGRKIEFKLKHRLMGHTARVADAKMHPMRKSLVATCSFDGAVILYDDGKVLLRQESGHDQAYRVNFHPDGGLFATCGLDGSARLWDLRSGRAVMTMAKAHADGVLGVEFSGDGRSLATGGRDNVVKIWDIRTRRCGKVIAAHRSLISGMRFGGGVGESDVLFTGSFDRTMKCWSPRRNWGLLAAHTSHDDKVTAIDCSPEGDVVVTACYDKTWKLWDSPF